MVTQPESVKDDLGPVRVHARVRISRGWLWGFASLLLRLAGWLWVVSAGITPIFDEPYYFERAKGFADLLTRRGPATEAWQLAYGHGVWPPLHPFLLGLASLIGTNPLSSARLVGVLLSALTTVLIYTLTRRLANARAAGVAAAIHAFSPTFIAFSHLLFSETLFICLLVGATLALVCFLEDASLGYGAICGVLLGLMLLTRASAIAYPLVFLTAALAVRGPKIKRLLVIGSPALVIGVSWLLVLRNEEGRFVFFATANGYNLYLGNNPYIEPGKGSAWADHRVLPKLQAQMIADTGAANLPNWDRAGATRAWQFISARPGLAVERAGIRAIETWTPDWYVRQYFNRGIYPPARWETAAVLLGWVGHFFILGFGMFGLISIRWRGLIVGLVLAGMVGPLLAIASSRFGLPMLVLLIVPAGWGVDRAIRSLALRAKSKPQA